MLMATLILFTLLTTYLFVVFIYTKEMRDVLKPLQKWHKLLYAIALLLPGLFLWYSLKDEIYIYVYDHANYWTKAAMFQDFFFQSPLNGLKAVYHSINYEEYNYVPVLLISLLNRFIGLDFNSYVFSIYLAYLVPFSLLFSSLLIRFHPHMDTRVKYALPFFILFFPPLTIPIRYGYPDITGLISITIILHIVLKHDFLKKTAIWPSLAIGLLLLALVFSRRWYAYWAVALFPTLLMVNAIYSQKTNRYAIIKATVINLAIVGFVPLLLILLFFFPFFEMSVLKDYKVAFAAYNVTPLWIMVAVFFAFFGLFIVTASAIGGYLTFKNDKRIFLFLMISTAIAVLLFTKVNDLIAYHHFYLLNPLILAFTLNLIAYKAKVKKWLIPSFFSLLLINYIVVFTINEEIDKGLNSDEYLRSDALASFAKKYIGYIVFSYPSGKPRQQENYRQIAQMASDITALLKKGNNVYCIASSIEFSDQLIRNIKLPNISDPIFKLSHTQMIDVRDHFPNELFMANYVITTIPSQSHMSKQKLVTYLNEEIISGKLSKHYRKIKEYHLKNGIKVFLMQKTSALNDQETDGIYRYFKRHFPDHEHMYAVNRNIMKTKEVNYGEYPQNISFQSDHIVNFMPGNRRSSYMIFELDSLDKTVSFITSFKSKEYLSRQANHEQLGEVNLIIKKDGQLPDTLYLQHKRDAFITIQLNGIKELTLEVDNGKHGNGADWFYLSNFQIKQ